MKECPHCGNKIQDNAIKCRYCNNFLNSKKSKELKGLSGWLILLILQLIFSAFFTILTIKIYFISQINEGIYGIASNSYSYFYIQGYQFLFLFEIIGNFLSIFFISLLIYLFFGKNKLFPKLFTFYIILHFIFILIDNILCLFWLDEKFSYIQLLLSFIFSTIWGLYIYKSIRVKNTFIEKSYKNNNILSIILLSILLLFTLIILLSIDISKLNYSDYQYGKYTCKYNFGEYSIYTGKIENGEFICDCESGYKFGGIDGNTCVKIK